jgi:hypothetical protein
VVAQPKLLKRLEVGLVKAIWQTQRVKARLLGATGHLAGVGVCLPGDNYISPVATITLPDFE